MAGFLVEVPIPTPVEAAPISSAGLEFLNAVAAALPDRTFEPLQPRRDAYQLETAGIVSFEPCNRVASAGTSGRERKLEVRDFVRLAPVVEIELDLAAGETGLETTSEPMEIVILSHPPQETPAAWQEPHVGFAPSSTELGKMGRLSFSDTGFPGEDQSHEKPDEKTQEIVPAHVAAVNEFFVNEFFIPEPPAQPVTVAEATIEEMAEPRDAAETIQLPEPPTKPLPLFLHLATPSKGKPMQVFSAIATAVEAQVPRSTSLPLRAVMTFGPAPVQPQAQGQVQTKTEVRVEPRKPPSAPVRPEPRAANGKARPVPAEVASEPKAAAKASVPEPVKETAKPVAKSLVNLDPRPEVKEAIRLKEDIKPHPLPAPLSAPYPGSNDLGLPRLNLETSSGFLGQIPIFAKVGIVAVLVAGLGCLIAFSSKSGGAAVTKGAGTIVEGSALPTGDAGWITDWGADPGVRRTRQISILRSSQSLTDYRIEMTGQIESKAIGWVFRAADPKNFYVTKLEIVKPGLEPTVALVRFAIVNGEEQTHAQLPLAIKARLDTMYKIRFDAVGDHFTTYVQDQKVDDWTDDRIKTGGVGFYRERGEDATLKGGMNVVPLVMRK
jgi:hypothetical protein